MCDSASVLLPEDRDQKCTRDKTAGVDGDSDPDFFSCLLQPPNSDLSYMGLRRLMLHRKAEAGFGRRKEWRCNGKGYVAYRNYIGRSKDGESMQTPSLTSTPGQSGRWMPSRSPLPQFLHADKWNANGGVPSASKSHSRSPSLGSIASDIEYPRKKSEPPAYSFVGMHCIFDQCKAMVTVVKFGHMSSDLLAFGASDGSLTVCCVSTPSILKQLTGHIKDITDFDFSSNNQYIASTSVDKTVRVWDISKGICMRVVYGVSSQLCIRFHPVNNNFLSVGNSKREIVVYNFSTGRTISKCNFDSEVTALDHDHTGQLIFCGDSQGSVYTVNMNSHTGVVARAHRHRGGTKSPVTTVQFRTFSLLAHGPVLLTFCRDGSLSFFSVSLEVQGYLTLRCSLKLAPRLHSIHASFCPLLSLEKGEFIVAGSEDANVYFYDLTRPKHTCVNKLQGHGYPVIGVAWNHGENMLASSDFGGTVIVWKRADNKSRANPLPRNHGKKPDFGRTAAAAAAANSGTA